MIADDVVERVREAADIAQIIGEFVKLKRVGTDFRGACPFHQGKNANFSVSPRRGQYHCFVCNESGDVITFLRKRLGLDFTAAVKLLGEKVGIEVIDTPTRGDAPNPNEPNWSALASAAEFFAQQLQDVEAGADARRYLADRGVDDAAQERFTLGFAPVDGHQLIRQLNTLGFDQQRLRDAGIVSGGDEGTTVRPRFRGRLIFPILDELGRHVAFGGRTLGDGQPKYLNSPESAVYQKRRVLYGMQLARQAARRTQRILVVEGYLDVIRVSAAGIEEVVAPLGTALTEEQAALIVRYAPEVFLLYDSDDAGLKATFRSGIELLRHGAAVRVAALPEGEDPDSFVRAHGADGLESVLRAAPDFFDVQVSLLARKGWFEELHRRRRAIDKLLPTIRATRDVITRDLYIARLAEAASLDKSVIADEANAPAPSATGRRRAAGATPEEPSGHADAPTQDDAPLPRRREWIPASEWKRRRKQGPEWAVTSGTPRAADNEDPTERELVRVMLRDRPQVERVAERFAPADFHTPRYAAIFAALLARAPDEELSDVLDRLAPELEALVQQLLAQLEAPADVEWSLMKLARRRVEAEMQELQQQISETTGEAQLELMRAKAALARERQALLRPTGARKLLS